MNRDSDLPSETPKKTTESQFRSYKRAESIVFSKTKEGFGGLSNMAAGFPLRVSSVYIRTSEALYQACRFPHLPEVQRLIIEEASPMTAKMKGKPYRKNSRPDWEQVRVKIMRWCLRVKLALNWSDFSRLLLATTDRAIVEESRKDDFWGAKVVDGETLVGVNALGRLLMELREEIKQGHDDRLRRVEPLAIADFLLLEKPISAIDSRPSRNSMSSGTEVGDVPAVPAVEKPEFAMTLRTESPSLFDDVTAIDASASRGRLLIDSRKPYPKYKDSGLPWLGRVPETWEMRPAFGVFTPNHERNRGMKEKTVLSLSYGRIVVKPLEKLHGLVPESFETYQIVNPGDIVLRTTDLQNDHTSLRVGMVRDRGIITSAYLALRVNPGVAPEFGFQFLNVWDTSKAIYGYGTGLRQNLDFSHFKRMPVAVPPPEEQVTVVRFLNWVNGRLERAIRAKRKIIALLNEQKQAIIHRAVTRGLDPSVPLKPSGIPWLGDIPQHWEVMPLKFLCRRIQNGATPSTSEQRYYNNGTVPWFGPSSISSSSELGTPVRHLARAAFADGKARLISGPAVLVIVIGATAGKMSLLLAEGATNQQITAFELKWDRIAPQFGIQQLRSAERWLRSTASTATIPILDSGIVNRLPLAFPPVGEQECILSALSKEALPLTTAISRLEREITLLREYRARLVADVVTGKLDVREAAACLPDEAPEATEDETDPSIDPEAVDEEAVV
jgi:type I restriction enzyme S subunit